MDLVTTTDPYELAQEIVYLKATNKQLSTDNKALMRIIDRR